MGYEYLAPQIGPSSFGIGSPSFAESQGESFGSESWFAWVG
jgi:hypothetical protein